MNDRIKKEFRYILRHCIDPGVQSDERFKRLLAFCRKAKINEVMFHVNCEELFRGHLTREETKPWVDMIAGLKTELNRNHIDVSINPWSTLSHADRGRTFRNGMSFTTMVDKDGVKSELTCCPLDCKFQAYLSDIFAYFAELDPTCIWVEDDFRFHNHAPLDWGCFCDLHLQEFSGKLGYPVSRNEALGLLFDGDDPSGYREIWFEINNFALCTLAERIGKAVEEVSSKTTLGLMSSVPQVHAAEGRDWNRLIESLTTNGAFQSRPHLPAYSDTHSIDYLRFFWGTTLTTMTFLPQYAKCFPELENGPWSDFIKSDKFAGFQIELSAVTGSDGIAMNLFDMMGNGVDESEDFDLTLNHIKPYISSVLSNDNKLYGINSVKCLFNPRSSVYISAQKEAGLSGLLPIEYCFGGFLTAMGFSAIPSFNADVKNEVVAISGEYLLSFGKEEIRTLFENNFVMMDGMSVITLVKKGCADLLGIIEYEVIQQNSGSNAYEQAVGGVIVNKIEKARMTCQNVVGDYVKVGYEECETLTHVRSFDGNVTGEGMVLVKNAFIIPYILSGYAGLLNHYRQDIIAQVLSTKNITYAAGAAGACVFHHQKGFSAINSTLDDKDNLIIRALPAVSGELYEILRDGAVSRSSLKINNGVLTLDKLESLSTRTFIYQ